MGLGYRSELWGSSNRGVGGGGCGFEDNLKAWGIGIDDSWRDCFWLSECGGRRCRERRM